MATEKYEFPTARANDGSKQIYYLDQQLTDPNLVVYIYLDDMAFLYSPFFGVPFNMSGRSSDLTSSSGYADTIDLDVEVGGVLEHTGTNFLDGAIRLYVPVLTSDALLGSGTEDTVYYNRGTRSIFKWNGSVLVQELVEVIKNLPSVKLGITQEILIIAAGTAGFGFFGHWPYVFNTLKKFLGVSARLVVDSGMFNFAHPPYFHMTGGPVSQLNYAKDLWGLNEKRAIAVVAESVKRMSFAARQNLMIMQALGSPVLFEFFGVLDPVAAAAWVSAYGLELLNYVTTLSDKINWWLPSATNSYLLADFYNTVLLSGQTPQTALNNFFTGSTVQLP